MESRPLAASLLVAALASAAGVPAHAEPPAAAGDALAPFGWLGDLAGACWSGSDAQGRATDRQCYSTQYGRFLRGTIELFSGSATGKSAYAGDSVFAWDAERGRIVYTYWASAGHHGTAEAYFDGSRLVFPPSDEGEPGRPRIRSIWERVDSDSFRVARETLVGEEWTPLMTATYRRDVPAPVEVPREPLAALSWLADSCWTGIFADGRTKDHVCYEQVFAGKFLRSRHRVVGGQPYEGETLISFDEATGAIRYDYYNSQGDVLRGEVVPTADGVAFPAETVTIGGESAEIRSSWKRKGSNGYAAITERRFGDEWRTLFTIEFARDPAPGVAGAEALAPLRHLAGGVWLGSGAWPDGSPLRVETRYTWGVTGRLLHFETFDAATGELRPLYDGLLFYDPQRRAVVQWNFKGDGTRDESVLASLDASGFGVEGPKARSRVDFVSADEMRWLLSVPGAAPGEWKRILEATYRRHSESAASAPSPPR